jgi:hypothetical protein
LGSTGKTARHTAGLLVLQPLRSVVSGYSVPEAVRDDKWSLILQLAMGGASFSKYADPAALATEE